MFPCFTLKTLIWQEAEWRCSVYSSLSFSLNVSIWTRNGTPFSPPCFRIVNSVLIQWTYTFKRMGEKMDWILNKLNFCGKQRGVLCLVNVFFQDTVFKKMKERKCYPKGYLDKNWGSFWRVPKELDSVKLCRVSSGVNYTNRHGDIWNKST